MVYVSSGCSDSGTVYKTEPSYIISKNLGREVHAVTEVYGSNNENAIVTFYHYDWELGTAELSPNNPVRLDLNYYDGAFYLKVFTIDFTEPTMFVPGQLHIDCEHSDDWGGSPMYYVGLLAAWTLD